MRRRRLPAYLTTGLIPVVLVAFFPTPVASALDSWEGSFVSPRIVQETPPLATPGDQVQALVDELQTGRSAETRQRAAEALGVVGSPSALMALRDALSEDPSSIVQAAAAASLGRGGSLAVEAVPDLIRALDRTGTDGTVCEAAAGALGALGRLAVAAIRPLASASVTGCGSGSEAALRSLAAIASDVSAHAGSQATAELEETFRELSEATDQFALELPPGLLDDLDGEIRSRGRNWLVEGAGLLALVVGTVLSALLTAGGVLAALTGVVLVVVGLLYARRLLGKSTPRGGGEQKFGWRGKDVEIWLKRPTSRLPRQRLQPDLISSHLEERAKRKGLVLSNYQESLEEDWGQFAGSAAGGSVPGFAAAGWTDRVLSDLENGRTPAPPGSIIEVVLGEIDARYIPEPGAPPKEMVHRVVQAVAWETMKGGRFTGWVDTSDLNAGAPDELVEIVLDYADGEMDLVSWDKSKGRVELPADEELTARLGSLQLLQHETRSSDEVIRSLGDLQNAAIEAVGESRAQDFLRTVACALLDAAAGLEAGDGTELGLAEEALRELAEVNPVPGTEASSPEDSQAETLGLQVGEGTTDAKLGRLLQRLRSESSPAVRERIVRAVGELGPAAHRAVPALIQSVEKDPRDVAVAAVEALGEMGPAGGKAVPLLVGRLEAGSPPVQMAAARSLGRMGEAGAEAAPVLLEWTSRDGVPHELRARAAEALGSIPSVAEVSVPSLAELLRSETAREVRAAAALALGRLDTGRSEVEALLQEAAAGGDPTVGAMAGLALLVRAQRLSGRPPEKRKAADSGWVVPSLVCSGSLMVLQFGAVLGSQILNPGQLLPALILTPALALLAGVGFGVITYPSVSRAALGGGASAFVGASAGMCLGLLVAPALTPLALAAGGIVALGSGALGGKLVRSAIVGG